MFDIALRRRLDPMINYIARSASKAGLSANILTIAGAIIAIAAGAALAQGQFSLALAMIAINRILDGIDGAVARIKGATAFGGYLDSLADYVFYIAVPLGFAFADPANMQPAIILLASFILTAISFLAYAAIAAKSGISETTYGPKAFLYSHGLVEGGETICAFAIMSIWPSYFGPIAYILSALCMVTVAQRIMMAAKIFDK